MLGLSTLIFRVFILFHYTFKWSYYQDQSFSSFIMQKLCLKMTHLINSIRILDDNVWDNQQLLPIWAAPRETRPVARQDSSPDIAHFVSGNFCDLDFNMTWVCVGGGGGGGRGGGGVQYLSLYQIGTKSIM